jgi:sacsin
LVILDPCRSVTDDGGIKLDIRKLSKLADQLSVFGWFISSRGKKFDGTIVRLPLRKEFSKISTNVVQASDLRTLLEAFIEEELNICSMFLRNLTSVEVYEVDHQNKRTRLAESHIQRSQKATKVIGGNPSAFFTSDVRTTTFDNGENSERWVVHESEFSLDVAAPFLSKRLQGNPRAILRQHKLEPKVVVAFPISVTQEKVGIGRLFTYLPLPIYTGFPIHIHALFALTQSRQNLFNVEEVGVVRGTDHRFDISACSHEKVLTLFNSVCSWHGIECFLKTLSRRLGWLCFILCWIAKIWTTFSTSGPALKALISMEMALIGSIYPNSSFFTLRTQAPPVGQSWHPIRQ